MENEFIKNCDELSENLKRCRKRSGLTKKQVARQLDVEINYYQYIEDGHLMPSIFKLIRLSEIFGVKFSEIICKNNAKIAQKQIDMIISVINNGKNKKVIK